MYEDKSKYIVAEHSYAFLITEDLPDIVDCV